MIEFITGSLDDVVRIVYYSDESLVNMLKNEYNIEFLLLFIRLSDSRPYCPMLARRPVVERRSLGCVLCSLVPLRSTPE